MAVLFIKFQWKVFFVGRLIAQFLQIKSVYWCLWCTWFCAICAIFGSHWCYGKWPANWEYQNIAILEFYPIVLSLYLWGEAMSNQCILFFTDNESLVHVINRKTCKDKHLMAFVRKLVSICLRHNILFETKHMRGIHNNLADVLSRLQVQTLRHLAPAHMDPLPTDIPQHLQPQNWVQ